MVSLSAARNAPLVRRRGTDAVLGSTSVSFCVNQPSGNITKLLEYKMHLLEICLSLLCNRMGRTLPADTRLSAAVLGRGPRAHGECCSEPPGALRLLVPLTIAPVSPAVLSCFLSVGEKHWHGCPGRWGVPIPGGGQGPQRCGTEGCGQRARSGGSGLGLGI